MSVILITPIVSTDQKLFVYPSVNTAHLSLDYVRILVIDITNITQRGRINVYTLNHSQYYYDNCVILPSV